MGRRIETDRILNRKGVVVGLVLGLNLDEAAREVGRNLRRGGFQNQDVLDLPGGDHVEREGPRIGLRTRNGRVVDPHVVVALRKSPGDDKFVVDERDARNAPHDLAGITVLRAGDRLARNAADHLQRVPYVDIDGRFGIRPSYGRDDHLADLLRGLRKFHLEARIRTVAHLDSRQARRGVGQHAYLNGMGAGFDVPQMERAVDIGGRAARRPRQQHRGTQHRLASGRVGHHARDGALGKDRLNRK